MTCIVGIETENGIIMGADSCGASGWDYMISDIKKVFNADNFLIGATTSFRMSQLLQYKLKVPTKPDGQEDFEYMCTTFIDTVLSLFKDNNFTEYKNGRPSGGDFLVGYNNKIYKVFEDFQVNRNKIFNFNSCGGGDRYALGSLYSTKDLFIEDKDRVLKALDTASKFSNGVFPPFYIEERKW